MAANHRPTLNFAACFSCDGWKMFKPVFANFFFVVFHSAVCCSPENLSFIFPYVNLSLALGSWCHCVIAGLVVLFLPEEMQAGSISAVVCVASLIRPLVFSSRTLRQGGGRGLGAKVNLLLYVFLVLLVQYEGSWRYLAPLAPPPPRCDSCGCWAEIVWCSFTFLI